MQSAHSVRIVFVISKEDMAHKAEWLKILADSLHQYLSNYASSNCSFDDSESEIESESDESNDLSSDSDDDEIDNDLFSINMAPANGNFLGKLKDINVIFTKFASVKRIKKLFSDKEMVKLERDGKKHKSAFYYLNKHINKLVNSDNIILIDPINDDYRQKLIDIFVTNDAKWINVTHDNFQACISPEKMLLIAK